MSDRSATGGTADGHVLVLEVQIRTPAAIGIAEELEAGGFRTSKIRIGAAPASEIPCAL